jgi:hypothetical protein
MPREQGWQCKRIRSELLDSLVLPVILFTTPLRRRPFLAGSSLNVGTTKQEMKVTSGGDISTKGKLSVGTGTATSAGDIACSGTISSALFAHALLLSPRTGCDSRDGVSCFATRRNTHSCPCLSYCTTKKYSTTKTKQRNMAVSTDRCLFVSETAITP